MALSSRTDSVILRPSSDAPIHLDYPTLRKAVLVLRAVNHKLRQSIVQLLEENKRLTVTEIYVKLQYFAVRALLSPSVAVNLSTTR